ncbi:MAG TPA: 4-hydroxy-tetrahydrodipicolinate synthase [Gammaproteobacteria bacterium]|nr:4-hydroxy-tetrahydrodipicolinate synthase [Gammaproteobacteria bacterium]
MFKGSMTALITPMHEDGSIDQETLRDLVEWHIANKTDAIIATGTTGESVTLDPDELFRVNEIVAQQASGRIPVIAGTGTNSTSTTIKLSKEAKRAGADALLVVTPYYNKPTQNGLYEHYRKIADEAGIPIILYNVPGRTACDILPETVERLSKIKNIIGIKEATGKVERTQEIIKRCGPGFEVYSGDDATALDLMKHGAKGVISVTANIAPRKMHDMCSAVLNGDIVTAERLNNELMPLHKQLFLESNPIPTKWALQMMGKIKAGIRLPLLPLDSKYHQEVKEAMKIAGVIT